MTIRSLIMESSGDSIWYQKSRFQGSDTVSGDSFSRTSIDISSDGLTCVIGARRDDNSGGTDAGSVYIFTYSSGIWTQQARLQASDAASSDFFGNEVSISADGNTVAVGSYLDDNASGTDAGSVYVFTRSGTTWTQQAKLIASDATSEDIFGEYVSLSSNGNTLVAGSRLDDNASGTDAGSVYVFTRSGTTWTQQAKLIASDAASNNQVWATCVSSDGNTLAFLAPNNTHSGVTSAGAAYVFTRSGTTWTQQAKLIALDPSFGSSWTSAAISGDGNTVIVGDVWNNEKGSNSGAVYVFTRSGSTWTQQAKIFHSDPSPNDMFGSELSITENGNVIAVGVYEKISNGTSEGAVYVFNKNGSSWVQQAKLKPIAPTSNEFFGESVSIMPDGNSLIVGSALQFVYHFTR